MAGTMGRRKTMEDTHVVIKDLRGLFPLPSGLPKEVTRLSWYSIYDGHGGIKAAEYLAKHLHTAVIKLMTNMKWDCTAADHQRVKNALATAYLEVDKELLKTAYKENNWQDGSTAVSVLIINNQVYIANVGDAQAVLCRQNKARVLTKEHKPDNRSEKLRIESAGGSVTGDNRVMGVLGVSRSFGDAKMKKAGVICRADTLSFPLKENDDAFLLLACDGLWDVFKPSELVECVLPKIESGVAVDTVVDFVIDEAMNKQCQDNCSVCLLKIGSNPTTD
eukprot:TRINITY_DN1676_c0_g1_i1.p1 TRINITY_DN1676_c0_g1~~TRINITY_DN1676_c0_g1_i1.p1  ORF type:complete len:277 (+),score=57.11 TRINITY_DN1676_c0_g1_i1:259-1089(+)